MSLSFHLGARLLSLAIFLQGLYIAGVFDNHLILKTMSSGIDDFQERFHIKLALLEIIKENVSGLAKFIGFLLVSGGYNVLSPTSSCFKISIIGLIFVILTMGIPWKASNRFVLLSTSEDFHVFTLLSSVAMIGGIIYWIYSTKVHIVKVKEE